MIQFPDKFFDFSQESLFIHFFCDVVRCDAVVREGRCSGTPVEGSSAGSAEAVLVKAFRTRNASIGERSRVPPSGGITPRNMFR